MVRVGFDTTSGQAKTAILRVVMCEERKYGFRAHHVWTQGNEQRGSLRSTQGLLRTGLSSLMAIATHKSESEHMPVTRSGHGGI